MMRFSSYFRWISASVLVLALSACGNFHIHDEGRLNTATQAKELATEFTSESAAIFKPMEDNLDALTAIEDEIIGLANEHEFETYKNVVAGYKADQVADELVDTMADWQANIDNFDTFEMEAISNVNIALDRREIASLALKADLDREIDKLKVAITGETDTAKRQALERRIAALGELKKAEDPDQPRDLNGTLKRLTRRLGWMDTKAEKFLKAFDKITGLAKGDTPVVDAAAILRDVGEDASEGTATARKWLKIAQDALNSVEKDEQVTAARALLAASIQEQLAAEQKRIAEYQRYLGEIRRLHQTFYIREQVAVCRLFIAAFSRVLPGAPDHDDLIDTFQTLRDSGRYDSDDRCSFPEIRNESGGININPGGKADWDNGEHTLAQYIAANVSRLKRGAQGPQLIAALGILAFVERPFLDAAVNRLYVERNRHALRLSKINTQQRADLLRDLAASLEIYEQGGIKPEEISELFLLASQVGALFFIGVQQ